MGVRLGTNGFTVSKHQPEEIGMQQDPAKPFTVEVRAKYFHIMYIPFFATGKETVLLFRDGNRYIVPDAYKAAGIALAEKAATPWYSFSGLILAPLVLFGVILFLNMRSGNERQEIAEEETRASNTMLKQIESTAEGDYFLVEVKNAQSTEFKVLKVDSADANLVYFTDKGIGAYMTGSIENPFPTALRFGDTSLKSVQVKLPRSVLRAATVKEEPGAFQPYDSARTFVIYEIRFIAGPEIENTVSPTLVPGENSTISMRVNNSSGTITALKPRKNITSIESQLPIVAKADIPFDLAIVPKDYGACTFTLEFKEDASGKIFKYFIMAFNGSAQVQAMR